MSNVWITSDTHYNHQNIVKGCSKWDDTTQCRPFNSLKEHNETLVKNINKNVKYEDHLYHLGDWSFGGIDAIYDFWKQLECKNIHFVSGNHDIHISKNAILKTDTGFINAQNLFLTYNEILEKKIGNDIFVMSHYAFRTWHRIGKGAIMLYGHSHGNLPDYIVNKKILKCMDVGIDTHPEFRPYHIDEIRTIMSKREAINVEK